jgi:xanthine dehydrogenase accessory factor
MKDLLPLIESWQAQGEQVAVATVIRVTGSAPRPVGARMIASSAGRMAGSVSGGCVETTVYGEMMDLLGGGSPRVLRFGITNDMIWDVGLACGGTIDVLVQALEPALVAAFRLAVERGQPIGLATIVKGPGAVGETALVGIDGWMLGPDDLRIVAAMRQRLADRQEVGVVEAVDDQTEAFLEPLLPPPALYIMGGVHVAIPLTRFAKELGFRVVVVDPRSKFANRERFPQADEILVEWPDEALGHLPVDSATYIVLLTHDPKIDEPTLAAVLKSGAAYIGAIGSRKTHADRFERMAEWGVTITDLQRVHAPIGLDLGGFTPEETALSIMAEVVAIKNGRSGGSLCQGSGPIGGDAR